MTSKPILIVESPSKAKTISKYLGGEYQVLACVGHIKDLPRKELGVDVENNFAVQEVVLTDKKDFIRELKKLAKTAPEIIIATDPDREGEAIAAHIISEIGPEKVCRVQFTEITREGVMEGMTHPRSLDKNLVEARQTRRIIDRLVGYKVSRVLWNTLQKNMKFVEVALSAGRVQSAALKMIVERERLQARFRAASYFDLKAELSPGAQPPFKAILRQLDNERIATGKDFDTNTGRLKNEGVLLLSQSQAEALVEELKPGPWTVEKIEEKFQTSRPQPPFTTSTLQQEAARKLRFAARRTMRVAQRLYENGFITYMRTDSTNLSREAIQGARREISRLFGPNYLPAKPNHYATKVKNAQEAHEAIRPAGDPFTPLSAVQASLDSEAAKLYDLILKRTLACQMTPAKLKQVQVQIQNQKARFRATGREILFPGYRAAYVEGRDDSSAEGEQKERVLPFLSKGQRLACETLTAEAHTTKPPARFTEASLVKELETRGIGRPSTFHAILDTIQRRNYVSNKKGSLVPTFLGIAVTQLLENHFEPLVDSQFTARMEDGLDAISRGEQEALPFMKSFYYGSENQAGLETMLQEKVDIGRACTIPLPATEKETLAVRIGQYGPYLQGSELRKNIPDTLALGDLNPETIESLLSQSEETATLMGVDESSGENIFLKSGPFGPYVQLGETKTRKSVPKEIPIEKVDLEIALQLLSLPRVVGTHPETGEEILANYGRYGPYIKMGKQNKSLPPTDSPLDIKLERAVELFQEVKKGAIVLRELGIHPGTGEKLVIKSGRYGPYVTDGKTNASLPKGTEPDTLTLEQGVELINKRRVAGPRKKR